ncbi:hypothetical protein [Streptomyces sp. S.PB5]|uniref:hypothetical protein n=1 Tax=Streptomyces sp. S.PB5 TaxID=3020844 RepID=UPI0025AF9EAF|nr:hypothetical protein [Streptomyces sp. S.PB5]MDN3028405.1 hypothetical protein [Streptomyces sp. S.PB5]
MRPPRRGDGMLIIDDSRDRKDRTATAFTGPHYLGRTGKTDNGNATETAVTAVRADERGHHPAHAHRPAPARVPGRSSLL